MVLNPHLEQGRWVALSMIVGLLGLGCVHANHATRAPTLDGTGPSTHGPPEVTVSKPAPGPVETPRSRSLWQAARMAQKQGQSIQANSYFRMLVKHEPQSRQAVWARVKLAQRAVAYGHYDLALRYAKRPSPGLSLREEFDRLAVMARAYERGDHHHAAVSTWLAAGKTAGEDKARKDQATKGASRALFLAGQPGAAQKQLADPTGASLKVLIKPLLHHHVLERLYGTIPSGDPWKAWLALRVARERCARANLAGCMEAAQNARQGAKDPLVRREALSILRETAQWNRVTSRTIGVLLPLSGPYAFIGKAALQSIQLAQKSNASIRLMVRDTRGDAQEAARMARELILTEHVAVILGPIGKKETTAVVAVTTRYGIPHVHLSSRSIARPENRPQTALRFRMSQREEGAVMARYATTTLGIKRVGILFPDNAAGRNAMASFWDEVLRNGGEVRAVQAYAVKGKDFNKEIQALIGATRPGTGVVDFEALFIPGKASKVRRLVPFLKYWGLIIKTTPTMRGRRGQPVVQLLGTSGWNNKAVIVRGENLTDNAIFVTPFHADPGDAVATGFSESFNRQFNRKALAFHAEVFDAAGVLFSQVSPRVGSDHRLRKQILNGLLGIKNYRGATGLISVTSQGKVIKQSWLMTVDFESLRTRLSEEKEIERRKLRGGDSK